MLCCDTARSRHRVAWLVQVRTYCVPIATLNQNRQTRLLYLGDVQITRRLRPCSHVYLFFKNENKFYSAVWPTVYTYPVKTLTENASFSKTLSRKEIFENRRLIVYVWTDENRCFRYDDVIHHTQRTPVYGIQSQFHRFSVFVQTCEKDLKKLRVHSIFSTTEKKSPFVKTSGYQCARSQ